VTKLSDVAKRAGVSLSTASYVLSGKRPISEATRKRVLDAMTELGFHPNNQGRALASGRTRTIALLYPSEDAILAPMPMEFVTAAASQAEQRGYALVLSTTKSTREQVLSLMRRGVVDGYVVMEVSLTDSRVNILQYEQVPFSLIGRVGNNDGLNYVDLDFEHAVDVGLDHLLGLGHRSIALVCRGVGAVGDYGPTARMQLSFNRRMAAGEFNGRIYTAAADPAAGTDVFNRIIVDQPEVTALITSNTEAIPGVVRAARQRNIEVPEQLSILGVLSPRVAEFLNPPITAVDFPVEEMGRRGVDFLIDQLEGGVTRPQQLVLRSTLTIRASTGPRRDRVLA
jgi:DNA-binding LacI/PurR family transcriptional regulator